MPLSRFHGAFFSPCFGADYDSKSEEKKGRKRNTLKENKNVDRGGLTRGYPN